MNKKYFENYYILKGKKVIQVPFSKWFEFKLQEKGKELEAMELHGMTKDVEYMRHWVKSSINYEVPIAKTKIGNNYVVTFFLGIPYKNKRPLLFQTNAYSEQDVNISYSSTYEEALKSHEKACKEFQRISPDELKV